MLCRILKKITKTMHQEIAIRVLTGIKIWIHGLSKPRLTV